LNSDTAVEKGKFMFGWLRKITV